MKLNLATEPANAREFKAWSGVMRMMRFDGRYDQKSFKLYDFQKR